MLATVCFAQSVPPGKLLSTGDEKPIDRTVRATDLSREESEYLWAGTIHDKAGFIHVAGLPDYMEIPATFAQHKDFIKAADCANLNEAICYKGQIKEDAFRVTKVFATKGATVAITVWDYKKAGAGVTQVDEFQNQIVNGQPATLSLVTAQGMREAVWKLAWLDKGISYELYVTDVVDSDGRPQRAPRNVLAVANKILVEK